MPLIQAPEILIYGKQASVITLCHVWLSNPNYKMANWGVGEEAAACELHEHCSSELYSKSDCKHIYTRYLTETGLLFLFWDAPWIPRSSLLAAFIVT